MQQCYVVDGTMTGEWQEGWYVVNSDVTMTNASVTCKGEVNLILADGYTLKVTGASGKAGICVSGTGNSLTIYGQTAGTGKLEATGGSGGAGIGGGQYADGSNITINGGTVTATGGDSSAGIGGGRVYCEEDEEIYGGNGSKIKINGGTVTAIGDDGGAGIGGGSDDFYGEGGTGSDITVNGGTVTAVGSSIYSSESSAGIGGGAPSSSENTSNHNFFAF